MEDFKIIKAIAKREGISIKNVNKHGDTYVVTFPHSIAKASVNYQECRKNFATIQVKGVFLCEVKL